MSSWDKMGKMEEEKENKVVPKNRETMEIKMKKVQKIYQEKGWKNNIEKGYQKILQEPIIQRFMRNLIFNGKEKLNPL